MTGCPSFCVQTTPHGIHQSTSVVLPRGTARWTINLGQVDGCKPHVTVVYLGVNPSADACWQVLLPDAPGWATFAARLGGAEVAAAITAMAERAGELVTL